MAPLHEGTLHVMHARATVAEQLTPTGEQKTTLLVLLGYVIFITIAWNLWGIKHILYPWKLWTVAMHEFSHAAAGCCTGARILSVEIDPDQGGLTKMKGGSSCWTLPAGYLGSSFIGAVLVFAGFDTVASKVASIVIGLVMLFTIWWARRSWLTLLTVLFAIGMLVAFWFIDHGRPLRFYVLFVGTMSALYALYDIMDDLIFRKVNESDASQFARLCPIMGARLWGCLWLIIAFVFFACGILAGLAAFKDSAAEQAADSSKFLPTR